MLAHTGHDIAFLAFGINKSPDILFRGKKWEIKSPKRMKRRTIENNIRNALKQSRNIIVDLDLTKSSVLLHNVAKALFLFCIIWNFRTIES